MFSSPWCNSRRVWCFCQPSVLGAHKITSAPPGDLSPCAVAADRFAAQTNGGIATVNVDM